MTDTQSETAAEREAALGGIGCDKRRKEDARFIRGQACRGLGEKLQGNVG